MNTAFSDLISGFVHCHFWGFLGWHDIRQRYRRSVLGPFWVTMSMAVFVTSIGLVFSRLFSLPLQDFLPYLAAGYLGWFFISAMISESCSTLIEASVFLREISIPITTFVARLIWRNCLIFCHNLFVVILAILCFNPKINLYTLYIVPGMLLLILNFTWFTTLMALVGARFRDVQPIVQSAVQVLFFVTPIAWKPELLGEHSLIIKLNVLNDFVNLIRAPLLAQETNLRNWIVGLSFLVLGWLLTFFIYSSCRKKIIFWL